MYFIRYCQAVRWERREGHVTFTFTFDDFLPDSHARFLLNNSGLIQPGHRPMDEITYLHYISQLFASLKIKSRSLSEFHELKCQHSLLVTEYVLLYHYSVSEFPPLSTSIQLTHIHLFNTEFHTILVETCIRFSSQKHWEGLPDTGQNQ